MLEEEELRQQVILWMKQDHMRMQALHALARLEIEDAYIAAGFIRNLIWDKLHGFEVATPLNDIDVIYFNRHQSSSEAEYYEDQLKKHIPMLNWQVKNQAQMYFHHQHAPYQSILDAMSYWPEQETAIAVRIDSKQNLELISVYPMNQIFQGYIRYNPKASLEAFQARLLKKQWQIYWPRLKVESLYLEKN